jgi:hypothetical protein
MTEYKSAFEKQLDLKLDKMFGDKDPQLREILRLCFTNPNLTPEMIQATAKLNAENEAEARNYEEELAMTLDASGNPVMIDGKEPKASPADVIAAAAADAADDANPTTDEAVSYYKSRASH